MENGGQSGIYSQHTRSPAASGYGQPALTRLLLTLGAAVFDWGIIAATIWIAETLDNVWCRVAAIVVVASRQQALGVLAHEAIHWPKNSLRHTAILTLKYLCAWPILMEFESFRRIHLAHHRHLNTDADPDFVRNRPADLVAANSLWQLVRYGLGLNRKHAGPSGILKMNGGMLILWGLTITGLWYLGYVRLFLLYWVLPLFTWFIVLLRLRGILEHAGIKANVQEKTRTVRGNPLSNFLFLPHNIGLHGEHHRNPQMPFFRLRGLKYPDADWHTSRGVISASIEVLVATSWFSRSFKNKGIPEIRRIESVKVVNREPQA